MPAWTVGFFEQCLFIMHARLSHANVYLLRLSFCSSRKECQLSPYHVLGSSCVSRMQASGCPHDVNSWTNEGKIDRILVPRDFDSPASERERSS